MTPLEAKALALLRSFLRSKQNEWFEVRQPHKSARLAWERWELEAGELVKDLEKAEEGRAE